MEAVYRAAYFDLDGTLINSQGEIAPELVAEIRKLGEQGVKTAIATGRPSFAAYDIARRLEISSASMFFSGSLVCEPHTKKSLFSVGLEANFTKEFLAFCHERGVHCELYAEQDYVVNRDSHFVEKHYSYLLHRPKAIGLDECQIFTEENEVLKIVVMIHPDDMAEFEEAAREYLARCSLGKSYGASHPDIVFYNLTNSDAGREVAFEKMTALHGVRPEEVVCFGDAEADTCFFRLAGLGVAMGNASDLVKKQARRVADHVDGEGVLSVIRELKFSR